MKKDKKGVKTPSLWEKAAGDIYIKEKTAKILNPVEETEEELKNDPAAILFQLGQKTRIILSAAEIDIKAPSLSRMQLKKGIDDKDSKNVFSLLFGWFTDNRLRIAAAAVSIMILIGVFMVSVPSIVKRDSAGKISDTEPLSENLNNINNYDKEIGKETDLDRSDSNIIKEKNTSNSMASNLVADGEKVVRYSVDGKTEIIFITGLD